MKTLKMLGISLALMGAASVANAEHHMSGHKKDGMMHDKMHKEHMMKKDCNYSKHAKKIHDKTGGSGNLDKWSYKKEKMVKKDMDMDGGAGMSHLPHFKFKANAEVM